MDKIQENKIPPIPEETGVEGKQEKSSQSERTLSVMDSKEGFTTYPLSAGIESLEEGAIISRIGAKTFLGVGVRMTEQNFYYALQEKERAIREADKWRNDYYEKNTRNGILEERLKLASQRRIFQNILTTLGSVAAGSAFTLSPSSGLTIFIGIAGVAMCVMGWVLPFMFKEEK